jgi:aspartate/tyrosine/aromatic aminotransferase
MVDISAWHANNRVNHFGVFRDSGLEVKQYRYYDKKNINLDLNGMIEDLKVVIQINF